MSNETIPPVPPAAISAEPEPGPQPKRRWAWPAVAVGALLVGVGLGAIGAGAADPTESTQYRRLADAHAEAVLSNEQLQSLNANLQEQKGELIAHETEVTSFEAELTNRSTQLDEREAALVAREEAVTATEGQIEANTIPGEGVYVVGEDVAAGEYRTEGPSGSNPVGCYYAFLGGTDAAADIIDNNILNGPGRATLSDGDVFETTSCEAWTLIQ